MLLSRSMVGSIIVLTGVCLLTVSGVTRAEPVALDEAPAKEEKPKEKKAITVPAGTPMMVRTVDKVSSNDKPGRRFSATLEANLLSGDDVVANAGTQVYGQVVGSKKVGRGIVMQHADLVLKLTQINIEGTMYPIVTDSFSENSTGVILERGSVTVPKGSLLEFRLTQPLTVKK